jgi:putative membrane protein
MWLGGGFHAGWMSLWMIVPLLIVILLVWIVVRSASGPSWRSEDTPEQILKRRYARGEIEREEYERRLTDLRK